MKKVRVLSIVICLVMILASLMLMNSCKKKHYHNYEAITVAPTCTEEGYTSYKCECGESYVNDRIAPAHSIVKKEGKAPTCSEAGYQDYEMCLGCSYTTYTELPKLEHSFTTEVLKNPSAREDGLQRRYCRNCGESSEEQIIALSANLPKVSNLLSVLIGSASYTLDAGETKLSYVSRPTNLELADGKTYSVQLEIARAELENENGVPSGNIVINVKLIEATENATDTVSEAASFNIVIYVEGEDVSVSLTKDDGAPQETEFAMNEMLLTYLGGLVGLNYDSVVEMIYLAREAGSLLPSLIGMLGALENVELPTIDEEFISGTAELLEVFMSEAIQSTTTGAGYTEYTVNIAALERFINAVDGKTLADAIDEILGGGTALSVKDFIKKVPTLKVGEIADRAILFAESYDVEVDKVFTIVNYFITKASGTDFYIQNLINDSYSFTVAELVAEISGAEDVNATGKELEETVSALVDEIFAYDIDSAFNMMMFGTPDYSIDGERYSIIGKVRDMIGWLDEDVTLKITVDAEGALKVISAEVIDYSVSVTIGDNGANVLLQGPDGLRALLVVTEEELSIDLTLPENKHFEASVRGSETFVYAVVRNDYKDILIFDLKLDEETRELKLLDIKIYGNGIDTYYVTDYVTGELVPVDEEKYMLLVHASLTRVADKNYTLLIDVNKSAAFDGVLIEGSFTDKGLKLDITPDSDDKATLTVDYKQYYLDGELKDEYTADFYLGQDRLFGARLVMAGEKIDYLDIYTAYREYLYEEVYDSESDSYFKVKTDEYYVFDDTYIELTSSREEENFVYELQITSFYYELYSDGSYDSGILEQAGVRLEKTVDLNGQVHITVVLLDEEGAVGGGEVRYEKTEDENGAVTDGFVSLRIYEIIEGEECDHVRFFVSVVGESFGLDIYLSNVFKSIFDDEADLGTPEYKDEIYTDGEVIIPGVVIDPDNVVIDAVVVDEKPVLDLHVSLTNDGVCDNLNIKLFDTDIYFSHSDKSIMALVTHLGKDVGGLNIGWDDNGSAHFVVELFEYVADKEDPDYEESIFEIIDKYTVFELNVEYTEEKNYIDLTIIYGEDTLVDFDLGENISIIINHYKSEWVDDGADGYFVDVLCNYITLNIDEDSLHLVTEEGTIDLTYTEYSDELVASKEQRIDVEADYEGDHYEGYLVISDNSDRLAFLADLSIDEYDVLDLDLAFWTDGGISLTLLVNDLIEWDTIEGGAPIAPMLDQIIKVNFSMTSDENSINNSLFLELSEGDVLTDFNYSVLVSSPSTGMGVVIELNYNINKLVINNRTCSVGGGYDSETNTAYPVIDYEVCEYIEGVGKLVFSVITEE